MWSPARLFSLYDALQLAARQVLAFLDSLEHRAIAVAPIIFSRTEARASSGSPRRLSGRRRGERADHQNHRDDDKPTAKLWPASCAGANVDRPASRLLKRLVVLRVSSGWLPE
jgi:hypothetical protein